MRMLGECKRRIGAATTTTANAVVGPVAASLGYIGVRTGGDFESVLTSGSIEAFEHGVSNTLGHFDLTPAQKNVIKIAGTTVGAVTSVASAFTKEATGVPISGLADVESAGEAAAEFFVPLVSDGEFDVNAFINLGTKIPILGDAFSAIKDLKEMRAKAKTGVSEEACARHYNVKRYDFGARRRIGKALGRAKSGVKAAGAAVGKAGAAALKKSKTALKGMLGVGGGADPNGDPLPPAD